MRSVIPYLQKVAQAVEAMHGCQCSHESEDLVHEKVRGQTVWRGMVETYILTGHPKATKAFAWGWRDDAGEMRFAAVLNLPPVKSPQDAVKAFLSQDEEAPQESRLPSKSRA